jgi:CRISPR-associated protein Cas1
VFSNRNRRPPLDPVNAMLSLGYTLLAQTITMILDVQGINSQIGFFHQPKDLRSLLVLDIMEQYRAWIVDDMVIRLIHHNQITLDHFVIDEHDAKLPCRLTDDGLKIVLNEYYRLMFKEKDNGNLDTLFVKLKIIEKDIE